MAFESDNKKNSPKTTYEVCDKPKSSEVTKDILNTRDVISALPGTPNKSSSAFEVFDIDQMITRHLQKLKTSGNFILKNKKGELIRPSKSLSARKFNKIWDEASSDILGLLKNLPAGSDLNEYLENIESIQIIIDGNSIVEVQTVYKIFAPHRMTN